MLFKLQRKLSSRFPTQLAKIVLLRQTTWPPELKNRKIFKRQLHLYPWANFIQTSQQCWGGRVVRWSWVNFQCRGVLQFGYSRAIAYCACSRCGWVLFGHFYSPLSFLFSFSLSLGDWGGLVVRWCWVNFQCRGVLQFGLQ